MKVILGLILACALCYLSVAHADASDATANIKIKITGATQDNNYFLCIPDVGCLSILAAQKGKVFPIFHAVAMEGLYVTTVNNFRLYPQGLPRSCNVTVNPNQTLTIYGQLSGDSNTRVEHLRCAVS